MNGISGTNNNYYIKEYVTPDVKERYDQLLNQIQQIMARGSPYSDADSKQIEALLKELKGMYDQGLTPKMENFLNVLFAYAEAAGANPSQNNFYIPSNKIEALSQVPINIDIKGKNGYETVTMNLAEALNVISNPDYDIQSTQKLGDMLIDFSSWGYGIYTDELKKLKEQLEISTAAINNLKAFLDILNMFKVNYGPDYEFPPIWWDKIPKEIQRELQNTLGSDKFDANGKPKDMSAITEWVKNNPDTYAGWSETYFKKEMGITPDPQPDASTVVARLLAARDALKAQLEKLDAAGADQGEGSPYATIKKALEEIDKEFPPKSFPYTTPPTDWSAKDGSGKYINFSEGVAKYHLNEFIIDGNDTKFTKIRDSIDNAIQSNQNLSSKMSDEIKAKNLMLQTFFDILAQVADSLSKILQGSAQKISR